MRLVRACHQRLGIVEEQAGIVGAALVEIGPEPLAVIGLNRRKRFKARVRLVVARQHRDLETVSDGRRMQGFEQIAEIAGATERPDDDQLRMTCRALDIGIDRHRVHQVHEAGNAQAQATVTPAVGGGDRGELGVGGRQEQDVGRRLPKVDRLVAVGDRSFLGEKQMHDLVRSGNSERKRVKRIPSGIALFQCVRSFHSMNDQTSAAIAARTAASSMSCRPMTTRRVPRFSPAAQARS
ncbi:hypothetical protein D9M72_445790 [compost metagenome]